MLLSMRLIYIWDGLMRLSVIVPIYNAEKYLRKCMESILRQTFEDFEIILINDGSTDESGDICEEYSGRDKRIEYLRQENQGVVRTRQRGIACAHGEYVTFVDADDYIDSEMYSDIFESIYGGNGDWTDECEKKSPDIVAYDITEEDGDNSKISRNHIEEGYYCEGELVKDIYPQMLSTRPFFSFRILPTVFSKLFRREFLNGIPLEISSGITFGEDVSLTFQALVYAKSLQVIRNASYHYIKRSGTMTWNPQSEGNIALLEQTLKKCFIKSGKAEVMQGQLNEYMIFVRLLKAPQTVEAVENFFSQDGKKIALYGAGGFGQALHMQYHDSVGLWVDRDYGKYAHLDGRVEPIDALIKRADEYDMIYIAILNEKLCGQIKEELVGIGVTKEISFFEISKS